MRTVQFVKMVVKDEKYKPQYANETDACMDLRVVVEPQDGNNSERTCFIAPGETKVFGTGLHVSVPLGHVLCVVPRSSTGFKLNCMLANTVGIVDAGYRDEIKLAIHNFGKETVCLQDGQRVAQFTILPTPQIMPIFGKDDENFRQNDRGGGIGSTNEKLGI